MNFHEIFLIKLSLFANLKLISALQSCYVFSLKVGEKSTPPP